MSTTLERQREADWRERLDRAREILQPTEVNLHHVPNWFRRRLLRVFGCRDRSTRGFDVLQHAATVHFGFPANWLDNWGSTDGSRVFVSEPYQVSPRVVALLDSFAKRLGIKWHIDANSWWNPGSTIRLALYESQETETIG